MTKWLAVFSPGISVVLCAPSRFIRKFVAALSQGDIGWTFLPYKRMDAMASFVSWQKPRCWDEMPAGAELTRARGNAENLVAVRLSLERLCSACEELLQQIRVRQCQVNIKSLQALTLTVTYSPSIPMVCR